MMLISSMLSVFVIFIIAIDISSQENIRFTISGKQCVFPSKYKDTVYSNCILNEKGQEWCYTDNLSISWDFCSRGDFQILSSILIKNIQIAGEGESQKKQENCLFHDNKSKRLFATNCNALLTIKSKKIDKYLDTSQFEFFWLNQNQIKTKGEKCLNPVETSIIKNNVISYHGFVDIRDCYLDLNNNSNSNNNNNNNNNNDINEGRNLNSNKDILLQTWKMNENNRIINKHNKKCLVISKEFTNLLSLFDQKQTKFLQDNKVESNGNNDSLKAKNLFDDKNLRKELKEFKLYDVFLGDCFGNTKGYEGRENFVLEEFRTEKLEMMALYKLVDVYKKANDNIENLISKSSEDMIKLIKMNSKLIDNRQLIDNIETKLEESQANFDKIAEHDDIESFYEKDGRLKKSNLNFEIYGLTYEKIDVKDISDFDSKNTENQRHSDAEDSEEEIDSEIKSLEKTLFLSSPNIESNYISIFNTYDYLNDFYSSNFLEDKLSHKIKLEELVNFPIKRKFIHKASGYLVNNITENCENESFSFKVETNLRFKMILNNNLIFSNDDHFESLKNLNSLSKNNPDANRPHVDLNEMNTFNSKSLCLDKGSLNQITIFYQFYYDKSLENELDPSTKASFFSKEFAKFYSPNNLNENFIGNKNIFNKLDNKNFKAHFTLSYVKDKKVFGFKPTDFIPFAPYERFMLEKPRISSDSEALSCKASEQNVNFSEKIKTKIFVCPETCAEAQPESICRKAYESGVLPGSGGSFIITKQNESLKLLAAEFPKIGLDYMISDLKLGYEEDFKKFSQQANSLLFKNYMVKIDVNSTLNEDDSFLFYKKDLVFAGRKGENRASAEQAQDAFIVLNAKIICDNSEEVSFSTGSSDFDKANESKQFSSTINSEKAYYESLGLKVKIEKIHDIMNSFTIIVFKTLYSNYLKSYKSIRYLDDIDLKMFKKNEIFKYKSRNEPDFVYDQLICVTDTKKIVLKTKHGKHSQFNALTDYIATLSTSLQDVLAHLNANFLNEVKLKCVLTLKDFEAQLTEKGAKAQKHSVCLRAYEDGLITKFGSVFKILKLTNKKVLFESVTGSPVFSIHEIENFAAAARKKDIEADNDLESLESGKFKIFQSESFHLENEMNKFIENYVNKNEYEIETEKVRKNLYAYYEKENSKDQGSFSSFIEVSSSTKFYSNDLLIKIEDGMNHITEKIIDSSKKISELSKINEDLEKKIDKIEKGKNSIEVINNRVSEISKLETNLEDRLKKKFLKYQKILKEKDSQINSLQQINLESQYLGNFKSNNYLFDLSKNFKGFFTNWIIVDSIDSLNGPSNWNLKRFSNQFSGGNKNNNNNKKAKIILQQSSQIVSNQSSNPSTSILFRDKIIQENLYFKFVFLSKVSGEIFINFKYVDFENYLQLRLSRVSETKGKISLIINKGGSPKTIADLDCERMVSFLKKCSGFEIGQLNKIEIFSFKEKYVLLFNDMIIFTASLPEIIKDANDKNVNQSIRGNDEHRNRIEYGFDIGSSKSRNARYKFGWAASRIQIGINNQKNFEVHELQIKALDLDDVKKFQSEINDVKNYARGNDYKITDKKGDKNDKNSDDGSLAVKIRIKLDLPENKQENQKQNRKDTKTEMSKTNLQGKLKYNPITNSLEEVKEESSVENESINHKKDSDNANNSNNSKRSNPNPSKDSAGEEKKKILEYKNFLNQKCLLSEKEKYVCNYISNIISKRKIDIKVGKTQEIADVIKENCMQTMKNASLCNQIIMKIEPIIEHLKLITSLSTPLKTTKEDEKSNLNNRLPNSFIQKQENPNKVKADNKIKREINLLISSCNFDFLPALIKNRKICLNDILAKELENRRFDLNDSCVKQFCLNCCFINYGNNHCKICKN